MFANPIPAGAETDNKAIIKGVSKGVIVAILLSLVIFAIVALFMLFMPINESYTHVIAVLVSLISVFAGGFIGARKLPGKGWLYGGLVGLSYILILYIIGMVTVTGFVFGGTLFLMLALGFAAGAIGGIASNNIRGNNRRRARR